MEPRTTQRRGSSLLGTSNEAAACCALLRTAHKARGGVLCAQKGLSIMRVLISILTISSFLTSTVWAVQQEPLAKEYVHHTVNKGAAARSVAAAGIAQAENSPHEWGGGWSGFGKRLASSLGTHAVKSAIHV